MEPVTPPTLPGDDAQAASFALEVAKRAINFKLDIKEVADPEGGSRAVITLDGKYLPVKPF